MFVVVFEGLVDIELIFENFFVLVFIYVGGGNSKEIFNFSFLIEIKNGLCIIYVCLLGFIGVIVGVKF